MEYNYIEFYSGSLPRVRQEEVERTSDYMENDTIRTLNELERQGWLSHYLTSFPTINVA